MDEYLLFFVRAWRNGSAIMNCELFSPYLSVLCDCMHVSFCWYNKVNGSIHHFVYNDKNSNASLSLHCMAYAKDTFEMIPWNLK